MTIRPGAVAVSRAIASAFLLGTALYAIVAFTPYGYEQFIKPHAIDWVAWCVAYFDAISLAVLSVTIVGLTVDVERRSTRILALALMCTGAPVVAWLFVRPVLESLSADTGAIAVGASAIALALWLALIDHVACWRTVFDTIGRPSDERRLFAAAAAALVYVVAVFAAMAFLRPAGPADLVAVSISGVARGLLLHAVAFAAAAWLLVGCVRVAAASRRSVAVEYCLGLVVLATAVFVVMQRLILAALDFHGAAGAAVSAALAVTFACSWSGIALRLAAGAGDAAGGLDILLRPAAPWRSVTLTTTWLVVLPAVIFTQLWIADRFGWPRLLQILCVGAVWVAVGSAMFRRLRDATVPTSGVALTCSLALLALYPAIEYVNPASADADGGGRLQRCDRYAAVDPSFSLLDDIASGRPLVSTAFARLERANSNIPEAIAIRPTSIEFTPSLRSPESARVSARPHIFVFAIDSLRPDYLSAYNPAVTFTPALGALARESLVFRNAFSRYGGTGLAVPSIWAGGMVPHRAYVTPFHPMNAMLKLAEANRYRVMSSFDTIMVQLLRDSRPPQIVELGGESWTARDDICRVLADLRDARRHAGDAPVFAYSLPQNVHLSYVQGHPILDEQYAGFYSPLAARVHQVDRCLGAFIDDLKADGSYDDSIIVITADHGDALGEEGRWGHGFAGYPEVLRIPLIVHLPQRIAAHWTADLDAVSFSTDIAPTLYRLLGYDVTLHSPIFGMPLVYPAGGSPDPSRRRGAFLVAASYGPVYGMLQRNGRSLYVADAVNSRDYAYDLQPGGTPVRVRVTGAERAANQRLIRDQLDAIAAFFHFEPQPVP
jgi:sulfatase-like protein